MKTIVALAAFAGTAVVLAAEPSPVPAPIAKAAADAAAVSGATVASNPATPADRTDRSAVPATPARRTVEHDGTTFELANSTASAAAETDEYVAQGEKLTDWTQLVTVQRLKLAKPQSAEEFVTYFQRKLQAEDGASLDVLHQGKSVCVFVVRFPQSDRNEEQMMICLAFVDSAESARLNVVQFAVKPARIAAPLVESRLKSWRDQFLRQAETLTKAGSA